jgi:hypothetical protein
LAGEAVEELIALGAFSTYSGSLPPGARQKLERSKLRPDDEYLLEDIFSERMIELTRNAYVEDVGDEDLPEKVLRPSYGNIMADIYSITSPVQSCSANRLSTG